MHVALCFTTFIFSYQKEEDDGGDMDSYQVLLLLLSILWHGAQLMLIASNFQMNKHKEQAKAALKYICAVHLRGYLGYKHCYFILPCDFILLQCALFSST